MQQARNRGPENRSALAHQDAQCDHQIRICDLSVSHYNKRKTAGPKMIPRLHYRRFSPTALTDTVRQGCRALLRQPRLRSVPAADVLAPLKEAG